MTSVQREYATALFRLTEETGETEAVTKALHEWREAVADQPDYVALLTAPSLSLAKREEAIKATFPPDSPADAVHFVQLLCRRGHIQELFSCLDAYDELLMESRRISVAQVTGAVALTPQQITALEEKLGKISGHTVKVECVVDPALLGGITVCMDGQVLDGSLRRRLQDLKEVIAHEPTNR